MGQVCIPHARIAVVARAVHAADVCIIAPFCPTRERRCVLTASPRDICTQTNTSTQTAASVSRGRDCRPRRSQLWASAMWWGEAQGCQPHFLAEFERAAIDSPHHYLNACYIHSSKASTVTSLSTPCLCRQCAGSIATHSGGRAQRVTRRSHDRVRMRRVLSGAAESFRRG
jgi:hypothetical protein